MRLKRVSLRGFRSYTTQQTIDFEPDVTILAGRNNVGKSALLAVLRNPGVIPPTDLGYESLAWIISREELAERLTRGHNSDVVLRHLDDGVDFFIETTFRPSHLLAAELQNLPNERHFPGAGPDGAVGSLRLTELTIPTTSLTLRQYRDNTRGGSRLWWANAPLNTAQGDDERVAALALGELWNLVSVSLSGAYYIHPRMPGSAAMQWQTTLDLAPDGSNLTNVVGTIFTEYRYTLWPEFESFIRDAFPEIRRIDVTFGGGPITAEIVIRYGEDDDALKVPLSQCGTGVELLMTFATAILTSRKSRLMLIDEPHAFLHPHAERKLIGFMGKHAEHQYVIATHSAAFLTAYPLTHARLLTIGPTGSVVANAQSASEILSELGVTASALWSHDAILWVEGPSEEAVCEVINADRTVGAGIDPVLVKQMPPLAFQAAEGARAAHSVVDFSTAIAELLLPLRSRYIFLFDSDERSAALKQSIEERTQGHARFLNVRELENLLMDPPAIQRVLQYHAARLNLESPTSQQVEESLQQLLGHTGDERLYPHGTERADSDRIVGSEVLDRIWWQWLSSSYDKVRDGALLASATLTTNPGRLRPLVELLNDLARGQR
jgi:predicted ATPase